MKNLSSARNDLNSMRGPIGEEFLETVATENPSG